jgi:hypothetical protein
VAAGDGRDDPVDRDAANAVRVAAVRNVRGPIRADGHGKGIGELRVYRAAVDKAVGTRSGEYRSGWDPAVRGRRIARHAAEEGIPGACAGGADEDECWNDDDEETTKP